MKLCFVRNRGHRYGNQQDTVYLEKSPQSIVTPRALLFVGALSSMVIAQEDRNI
jgi:hypothetical protein